MLITILATVVVLGVLIFVHELGHFVTAKAVGISVPRFSIGLGPKMFGFRRGETEYVISWLPFGGYVRMAGMEELEALEGGKLEEEPPATGLAAGADLGLVGEADDAARKARTFESKSLPARALVISAGVIMNALFAIIVFAVIAGVWGVEPVPDARLSGVVDEILPAGASGLAAVPEGTRITSIGGEPVRDWNDVRGVLATASPGPIDFRFEGVSPVTVEVPATDEERAELFVALQPVVEPVVSTVEPGSPAAAAGIRSGDRIVRAAGEPVPSWQRLVQIVQEHPEQGIELEIERGGRIETIALVPAAATIMRPNGEERTIGRIGVAPPRDQPGPVGALAYGARHTWDITTTIVGFLGQLVTGNVSPRNLGGPIMIGQLSGQVARAGIEQFLSFMALFSVNLAVLNLLPIPVLDGGQLVFLGVEAVRGRALSVESRMRLTQAGLFIVVALMVWALASDMLRLFGL